MSKKTETLTLPCGTKVVELDDYISVEWKKEKYSWTTHLLIQKDFIAFFDEMLEECLKNRANGKTLIWNDETGWDEAVIKTYSIYCKA